MRPHLLAPVAVAVFASACVTTLPAVETAPAQEVQPAEDFFCRYKLNPWYLPAGELRLERGQAPFVSFSRSHRAGVELTMPRGEAGQGMDAVFTSGWVTFNAHFQPKKPFEVHTRVPMKFGSVLRFRAGAQVSWLGSDEAGLMTVERAAPDHFKPAAPLRTALRCEDTTIGTDFLAEPEPEGAPVAEPRRVLLAAGVEIPVAGTPGGAPEGSLHFEGDEEWAREAKQLEESGELVRIRKEIWPAVVEGWVPRAQVAPVKEDEGGLSNLFGVGGLGMRGEGRGTPAHPRCAAETTLYLARDGALAKVGTIHKKAAVVAGQRHSGWAEISLPELDWMTLATGASWAVVDEELARCLPANPQPAPRQRPDPTN